MKYAETGSTVSPGLGELKLFRYRSYYRDQEQSLYYLQMRYYDSQMGRFLNADSVENLEPEQINGLNLYAYCGNNPVCNIDPDGTDFWAVIGVILKAIGKGIATAAKAIWKSKLIKRALRKSFTKITRTV